MKATSANLGSVQLINQHQLHLINIPSTSHTHPPQSLPLNLPCQDILDEGRREEYLEVCIPLYQASRRGDWKAAKDILDRRPELIRFSINRNFESPLHVAVYEGNTLFVKKLVSLMDNMDMELQNSSSNTALCLAAVAGHVPVAKIMVTKHKALLDIGGSEGKMPLYIAALSGKHDMVKYLYEHSKKMTSAVWTHESRGSVLLSCVEAGLFDVALQMVKDRPELAIISGGSVLGVLARKPRAFRADGNFMKEWSNRFVDKENEAMQLLRIVWASIVKLPKAEIDDILRGPADQIMEDEKLTTSGMPKEATQKYSSRVLFVATQMGNTAFIMELIREYPEQVLVLNDNKLSVFHVAISHRHHDIFSLLYEIGSIKDSIINLEDEDGNNMLHLVGIPREKTTRNQLQGMSRVVIQIQQELAWVKEVKGMLPPSLREKKNTAGQSPIDLFTENHKGLVSKSEEWLKKTSSQLMVAAALIVTISFAASITFVGGYNQNTGTPVLFHYTYFNAFMISNIVSFISASTSIFLVLSIIGTNYIQGDGIELLALKLEIVVLTLRMSMLSTIVAFSFNFLQLYHQRNVRMPYILGLGYAVVAVICPTSITNFRFRFVGFGKRKVRL